MAERGEQSKGGVAEAPTQELSDEFKHLMTVLAGRVMSGASDKVGDMTEKLTGVADGNGTTGKAVSTAGEKLSEGKSPLSAGMSAGFEGIKSKVSGIFGGGGKKGGRGDGKKLKVTNIIEEIDIGAPIEVVYNQWTQLQDFSGFMKKVESVDQEEDEQVSFKAQVLWSHRTWKATIIDQVPEKHIVWRSSGQKGYVDGAVTFHELAPDLTRVLVVLEYHPQGLFERTGNLWRAQGRRVRLELKHFRRHVMTQSMLHPDELEGWRGEIHDSEVTKSHEDAVAEEQDEQGSEDEQDSEDAEGSDDAEDEYDEGDEAEDEYEDDEESDEDEDAEDEEPDDEEPDDEYDDEAEDEYDEDDEDEDEYEEDDEEPEPARSSRSRRRAGAGRR